MSVLPSNESIVSILTELRGLPTETEWVEFKKNYYDPNDVGQYISAVGNGAVLFGKAKGYVVWGIDDVTHDVVGTKFSPSHAKKGNQDIEPWLLNLLSPRVDFRFHEFCLDSKPVVLLEIPAPLGQPLRFQGEAYIRIGSNRGKLKDYPEKERSLWRKFDQTPFEKAIACDGIRDELILSILDYRAYFRLLGLDPPRDRNRVTECLENDGMIRRDDAGHWAVLNLGAILLARELASFDGLARKAVRVIQYRGKNRIDSGREQVGTKGYVSGIEGLMGFVNKLIPKNEVMGQALRKEVSMYPEIAVRELVANAIIHQDFRIRGAGPMVEIFDDRMEITNPGEPLVDTNRFLDTSPQSRNEELAAFMRRIGVCEERGSGIDKVVDQTEYFQLPAPLFEVVEGQTRVTLFAHKEMNEMDRSDKVRACYLHACLKRVQREYMTNMSLRKRLGIEDKNSAMASRIIRDTIDTGLIRIYDESVGPRSRKYVPFWA